MSICNVCNKEFEQSQGRNRKRCNVCSTKIRRHINLLGLVKLLGDECVKCGYNDNPIALQFHHKDPDTKEFSIGGRANKSWEVLKEEALKCELLCANCHTIEHSDREQPLFLEAVANFNGKERT
jgi:hypothetical protein